MSSKRVGQKFEQNSNHETNIHVQNKTNVICTRTSIAIFFLKTVPYVSTMKFSIGVKLISDKVYSHQLMNWVIDKVRTIRT